MEIAQFVLRITTVVLGLGLLTVSCTSGPSTTRLLVDQPDRMVGMEVTYREGASEYSHPGNISAELLDRALQLIEVQPASLLNRFAGAFSTRQEAFSQDQRAFLTKHLSTAFTKASPLETVMFYWATPRGHGLWELTSGGLYIQEHDLHVVLPNYRHTLPGTHPPQKLKNHPLVQIDEPLYLLTALDPARQLTHGLVTELWSPQTPHFVFALKDLTNSPLSSNDQHTQPSSPPHNSGESIKQRLQTLQELRQEDLLTEKEYQHTRQDILEEL